VVMFKTNISIFVELHGDASVCLKDI
jgi:hypothetical protein